MEILKSPFDSSDSTTTQIKNELERIMEKESKDIDTIVLSGGGIKGLAQIGALHKLNELNILTNVTTYAGSSIGSFICTLLIIGYSPIQLFELLKIINIDKMKKLNMSNFLTTYGFDTGKRMMLILMRLFEDKKYDIKTTFQELYMKTDKTLIITGTCINTKKVDYFSHLNNPDMKVIDAVRISVSLPILFSPCVYQEKLYCDGGCIDNYPINIFDHKLDKVLGIFVSQTIKHAEKIDNIESFLINIISCLFEGIKQKSTQKYHDRTIFLSCDFCGINDWNINLNQKIALFDVGYQTVSTKYNA